MFRRDLLKFSPLAVASAAVGRRALAQAPVRSAADGLFNVRRDGATGGGKTVDTPAINRAIEPWRPLVAGRYYFPPARTFASPSVYARRSPFFYHRAAVDPISLQVHLE